LKERKIKTGLNMNNSQKPTLQNLSAIIAGSGLAILIFGAGMFISLIAFAHNIQGHGDETETTKSGQTLSIGFIITLAISCLIGGFVTGKICKDKPVLCGVITGTVLSAALIILNKGNSSIEFILYYAGVIVLNATGAALSIKRKKIE
jgi:O-antigen/teichoic acid export membrane protein